ncbi:MAG: hypothetical protein ACRDE5_15835, partial [Ginsengibacter sp.]
GTGHLYQPNFYFTHRLIIFNAAKLTFSKLTLVRDGNKPTLRDYSDNIDVAYNLNSPYGLNITTKW